MAPEFTFFSAHYKTNKNNSYYFAQMNIKLITRKVRYHKINVILMEDLICDFAYLSIP